MNCPECGGSLVSELKGSTVVVTCESCGWSVARSYVDPIYEDESVYSLYLECGNVATGVSLASLSKAIGCNYLQTKKLIDGDRVLLSKGNAVEIREKRDILDEGRIMYSIEPGFPY